jgi:hypothetical protein
MRLLPVKSRQSPERLSMSHFRKEEERKSGLPLR